MWIGSLYKNGPIFAWVVSIHLLILNQITQRGISDTTLLELTNIRQIWTGEAKQGSIKYYFLSFWYDSTWDWTPVCQTIGKHSTQGKIVAFIGILWVQTTKIISCICSLSCIIIFFSLSLYIITACLCSNANVFTRTLFITEKNA